MTTQHQYFTKQTPQNKMGDDVNAPILPDVNTKRWVATRKAQVIEAVRAGVLTLDEACSRYTLSVEEFVSWQKHFDKAGVKGLFTTKSKK